MIGDVMADVMCIGTTGKRGDPCAVVATYVDARGEPWCHVHADRDGCRAVPHEHVAGVVAYRRALRPAGGTVTDAELDALGSWARPRGDATAWRARVRELLAESPLRDLASAAIEARGEMGPSSREDASGRARGSRGGTEARRAAAGHVGSAKGLYVTIHPTVAGGHHG